MLAKELSRIPASLMGKSISFAENSGEFVRKIRGTQIYDETTMVSFDAVIFSQKYHSKKP